MKENGSMPFVSNNSKLKQSYAHVHKLGDNVSHNIGKGITLKQNKEKERDHGDNIYRDSGNGENNKRGDACVNGKVDKAKDLIKGHRDKLNYKS